MIKVDEQSRSVRWSGAADDSHVETSASEESDHTQFSFPASYLCVRFTMRCVAKYVCLVIGDDTGKARAMHQMEAHGDGRWQLALRLDAGSYRYRYYANRGAATLYLRPDEVEDLPLRMDGMDAVLNVSLAWTASETPKVK